jgi:fumarate reductase subunit C
MAPESKPKQLIRPMPADWWLKKPAYTWFMIRDITSLFIAAYCVFLMYVLCRSRSPETFDAWYKTWGSPLSMVLHTIALVFAAYHSITFFNLTPRVLVMFQGDEKVPDNVISGVHYAMWVVVSVIIIAIGLGCS